MNSSTSEPSVTALTPRDILNRLIENSRAPTLDELLDEMTSVSAAGPKPQLASGAELIVQDFRPLVDSLQSELANLYWQTVGVQAFAESEVPFIINNDGRLSSCAAHVFFANCLEASGKGPLQILELGAGTGLFAVYFLDAFRRLCGRSGKDYYERLVYHVSDGSRRTVEQWREFAQFAEHEGHVVMGVCDATSPAMFHEVSGKLIRLSDLRAVFTNYLLDVLPAAVVRAQGDRREQLCVRTLLGSEEELKRQDPQYSLELLQRMAQSDSREERSKLLSVLNLLSFETSFVSVEGAGPPFMDEAITFAGSLPRVLLNFGAFDTVRTCLGLLEGDGFLLVTDYGPVQAQEVAEFPTANRFGSAIAMGLNFLLLEYIFTTRQYQVAKPDGDDQQRIHTRLLAKHDLPGTVRALKDNFSPEAWKTQDATAAEARKLGGMGQLAPAMERFREALSHNPNNWCLLGEIAQLLIGKAVEEGRLLAELHPDSLYPMIAKDPWVAGAERRGSSSAEESAAGADPTSGVPPAPAPPPATGVLAALELWSSARILAEGMEFARLALARNPWYSSGLWNVLGDGFYHQALFAQAETCYLQAKKINPKDVLTNFNLSFIYAQAGRLSDSLDSLSTALANVRRIT